MKRWVAVAAACGTVGVAGCATSTDTPLDTLGVTDTLVADAPIRLIVGDSFQVAVRRDSAGPFLTLRHTEGSALGATYASSAASIVSVSADGWIRALAPGPAIVTAFDTIGAAAPVDRIRVRAVTRRRAVNEIAAEICPNRDEAAFLAAEPLPAEITPIHEFHDCQRLITDREYGPLVGIFAHDNVRQPSLRPFTDGVLAAIIVAFANAPRSSAPYPSLGIAPGVNCLYLRWSGQAWRAKITGGTRQTTVPGGPIRTECPPAITWPEPTPQDLAVREQATAYAPNGKPVAPPVARWDWDEEHDRNYIGVRCDEATWCEIGQPGFVASEPLRRGNQPIIKGYYDQQYLSNKALTAPTPAFGTIVPWSDRTDAPPFPHDIDLIETGKPYAVGDVSFSKSSLLPSRDYNRYRHLFVHAPGFLDDFLSGWGPRADTSAYLMTLLSSRRARLRFEGTFNRLRTEVAYRYHGSMKHLAETPIVRWRWTLDDERSWAYCVDGCCEDAARISS